MYIFNLQVWIFQATNLNLRSFYIYFQLDFFFYIRINKLFEFNLLWQFQEVAWEKVAL